MIQIMCYYMKIKKIKVWNFKSFKYMDLDLANFNVIIGPNSSGKSNLISIFQFLKDISKQGIENAISLQGGNNFIFNLNSSRKESLKIEVVFGDISFRTMTLLDKHRKQQLSEIIYTIELSLFNKSNRLKEFTETMEYRSDSRSIYTLKNNNGNLELSGSLKKSFRDFFPKQSDKIPNGTVLNFLEGLPFFVYFSKLIHIYDIDPKLSKRSIPISGLAELESDAGNMAIILKKIITNKKLNDKLLNFLSTCLPFISRIDVENQQDKSIIFKLKEKYSPNSPIPATLISDGTIEIIAIIYALYLEDGDIVVIEEPEKNIHPQILSILVEFMKDVSTKKQIVITTHSPETIQNVELNNIILVNRDNNGNSITEKPSKNKQIAQFLTDNIGLSDLFVDGFLS